MAFVARKDELADFMRSAGKEDTLAYGKDEFLPFYYYWQIPLAAGGYLHRRMDILISSGIEDFWKRVSRGRKKDRSEESLSETGDGIGSNLAPLFKLVLLGHILSALAFTSEILLSALRRLLFKPKHLLH
jgi:hypothetical protein